MRKNKKVSSRLLKQEFQKLNLKKKRIEIWFQDELRAAQQGSLSRSWAIKGTRPRRTRQQQFKSSYLFGAICPRRNKGVALVLPYANTESMQLHLDAISKKITKGYHAVIVMDGAGWHLSKELNIPKNITIIKLPPYSPELNPMVQVFQQLRKLKLSNACYKDYDEIDQACVDAWNQFVLKGENIKNLALREWADCC